MDAILNRDFVLFLPGLKLEDFNILEKEFDNYMKDIVGDNELTNIVAYDKIPEIYNKDMWSKSTNLKCWTCDCIPTGRPLFIPSYIWYSEDGKLYANVDIENGANFCNPNCAYTWIKKEYPLYQHVGRISMLKQVVKDLFDIDVVFKEVKSKTRRREYGGSESMDEYISDLFDKDLYKSEFKDEFELFDDERLASFDEFV